MSPSPEIASWFMASRKTPILLWTYICKNAELFQWQSEWLTKYWLKNCFKEVLRLFRNNASNTNGPTLTQYDLDVNCAVILQIVFPAAFCENQEPVWYPCTCTLFRAVEIPCSPCPIWSHFIQDKLKFLFTCPWTSTNVLSKHSSVFHILINYY